MEDEMIDTTETHPRIIIHIDIDCFYAQVEELRNPTLRNKPLGIQQKNIVVTSNYVARTYGITKLMLLSEAQKLCPALVLVKGEDLTNYRKMSAKIFEILHNFTPHVEKLGLDENYMDVTSIIDERLKERSHHAAATTSTTKNVDNNDEMNGKINKNNSIQIEGHIFPEDEKLSSCNCGCAERLAIATQLAQEIRTKLHTALGITCCAGIAHNKLLAKIVGSKYKPNQQTVLVPLAQQRMMTLLPSIRQITGIGEKTEVLLKELKINSVVDLQMIELSTLEMKFGQEMANRLKDLSFGRDNSIVKSTGKPKSISLEDSCRSISLRADVEEKFRLLLIRLIEQVTEDGRIPIAIKIILRKFDAVKKSSHRETKQANILPSLFKMLGDGKIRLQEGCQDKLLKIVMRLFERSVDLKKPFNITLLGLAFSKFQERRRGSRCIANFLMKKSDVEVQSVTSLSSDGISPNTTMENIPRYVTSSPMHMDFESISDTSHASCSSDVSESEIEPSPKKTRIGFLMAKRRCFSPNESYDAASPSKLRVGELRLNSREFDRDHPMSSSSNNNNNNNNNSSSCNTSQSFSLSMNAVSPVSTSLFTSPKYTSTFSKSTSDITSTTANTTPSISPSSSMSSLADISSILPDECPPTVDQSVFKELPIDVQQDLINQWRRSSSSGSLLLKPSGLVLKSNKKSKVSATAVAASSSPQSTSASSAKSNTLHRYFIINKQH